MKNFFDKLEVLTNLLKVIIEFLKLYSSSAI